MSEQSDRRRPDARARPRRRPPARAAFSAVAMAALLALPPHGPAAAEDDLIHRIPDPVAHAKARIEQTCLNVQYGDAFARGMDLNADGLEDMVITDVVVCDGHANVFCGVGGCSGAVYVALPGGGYMLTDLPPNVSTTVARGRPAVRAAGQGRTGIYVWLGDRFIPENEVGRTRITAESAYGAAAVAAAEAADAQTFGVVGLAGGVDVRAPAMLSADGGEIDRWVLIDGPAGGARTLVRGADGVSALALGCIAGRPQIDLSLRPTRNAADVLPYDANARIDVNAIARGRVVAQLTLDYSESADVWRVAIPSRGALVAALEEGTEITFRQDGALDRLGRFGLRGSAQAIAGMRDRCQI